MSLLEPVKYPATAKKLAEMLIKISLANGGEAVRDALATELGGNVAHSFDPRTDARPAFGVFSSDSALFVFVEGCSFIGHGGETARGYIGATDRRNDNPVNPYFRDLAAVVMSRVGTFPSWPSLQIRLIGHSLGGAVVEEVALAMRPFADRGKVQVCTFGAPKSLGRHDALSVSAYPHARWMNTDDPVPLVFPTVQDNPALLIAPGALAMIRAQGFTHPAGGLEILASGTIRAASLPDEARVDAVTNIGAWLWSIDNGMSTPHDLDHYTQRLGLWLARGYLPSEQPRPSSVVEDQEDTSRVNLTRQEQAIVTRVQQRERTQRERILSIPPERLVTIAKVGKFYRCLWGGDMVATTTKARSARKVKNQLNDLLETLLQQGLVDPGTLRSQLALFIEAATTEGSGVSPQMSVGPLGS